MMDQHNFKKFATPVYYLIILTLFFLVLFPNPNLFNGRLEIMGRAFFCLVFILIFLFWLINNYQKKSKKQLPPLPKYIKIFFLGLGSWIIFTGLISFLTETSKFSLLNLGELLRYPIYFIIFLGGYYASLFISTQKILKWISWAVVISCLVALIQFFKIPLLYNLIIKIYGFFKLRPLVETFSNFRVYGTLRNANWFGISLLFVAPLIYYYYKNHSLWKKITIYGLIIIGIFISGSRSAWLGLILLLFISFAYFLIYKTKNKERILKKYILPLIILVIIFTIIISYIPITKYNRLTEFTEFLSSSNNVFNSISGRVRQWDKYFNMAIKKPALGFGSSQGWIGIPHNEYILLFVKYGLLAPLFFIIFLADLTIESLKNKMIFGLFVALSIIAFAYGNFCEDLMDTIQPTSLFLYITGFSIAKIHTKKIFYKHYEQ